MNLAMVRHAEPERIESGTGIPANPQLTANGREQAARLADWLAGERVDVVVSSPQRRAIETAEPVARAHGLTVEVVDGLVEMDVQLDHYIPVEELKATNDDRWHAMVQGRFHDYGGEDPVLFRNRVAAAIDEVIAGYPGRNVVAVCHGGVINVAFAELLGLERSLWFDPPYTSISRMVAARSGERSVVSLNEHAHLYARRTP